MLAQTTMARIDAPHIPPHAWPLWWVPGIVRADWAKVLDEASMRASAQGHTGAFVSLSITSAVLLPSGNTLPAMVEHDGSPASQAVADHLRPLLDMPQAVACAWSGPSFGMDGPTLIARPLRTFANRLPRLSAHETLAFSWPQEPLTFS